jgi:hypothetical protein
MGNYGNTMDRWYRRAAVVVWPRQYAFAARAEASPSWALAELRAQVDAGDLVNARAAAASVAPSWLAPGSELLEAALHAAAGLEDPGIALMLLRPFAIEWVEPAHASGLMALASRYDEAWYRDLLNAWFGPRQWRQHIVGVDRKAWAGVLPELAEALRGAGAAATAEWLLASSWVWLDDDIRVTLRIPAPATRRKQLAERGKPLAGLLTAADGTELAGEIAKVLAEHGDDMLACLLPTLRAAGSGSSPLFEELARDCERRLTVIAGRPARAEGDWSIPWSSGCGCELCRPFDTFLADSDKRKLEWPIVEASRKHIMSQIAVAELPVQHEVWKFGKPYTLVLTKTDELFRYEAQTREEAATGLEWLTAHRAHKP